MGPIYVPLRQSQSCGSDCPRKLVNRFEIKSSCTSTVTQIHAANAQSQIRNHRDIKIHYLTMLLLIPFKKSLHKLVFVYVVLFASHS
jgi:hypothetical protein